MTLDPLPIGASQPLREAWQLGNSGRLPRHVAIIMDGNGRWAQRRGESRSAGHQAGADSVRAVTRTARRLGLQALTLYAFSEQNWSRPQDEVQSLLRLLVQYLASELSEMRRSDIRLRALGNLARLPAPVRMALDATLQATQGHCSMTLSLALSYGGREEILHAARHLAQQVADGTLDVAEIDEARLQRALWTADLPSPDLIIRTSGEQRLSNFLLWQSAYAELYFTPVDWPDFRDDAFAQALVDFTTRQRRFGGIEPK